MNFGLFASNLAMWWAQAALLAVSAWALALALRLPPSRAKLFYWQLVALAILILPFVGPWQHEAISVITTQSSTSITAAGPAVAVHRSHVPWIAIGLAMLGWGVAVRLGLLIAGFLKLRSYRLHSQPLAGFVSPDADVCVCEAVASPVTFGFLSPVVLLPPQFATLDEATREAILCHELLHVRRRDWLFTVAEELVRAALWFHPAVWWTLNEIQLAREQVVDAAVVDTLRTRDRYVDALLTIAGAGSLPDLAPAPSFLRKRHLKQRLVSILQEVPMSRTHRLFSVTASYLLLAGSCWLIATAIPLRAAPDFVNDAAGVSVNTNGTALLHRPGVEYPQAAAAKGISGTVQLELHLDAGGNVIDAAVLSGPDELRKSVLKSVLDWHFAKSAGAGTRHVTISFEAPPAPKAEPLRSEVPAGGLRAVTAAMPIASVALRTTPSVTSAPPPSRTVRNIRIVGLPEEAQRELLAQLPVHAGEALTSPEKMIKVEQAVRAYDEHLTLRLERGTETETDLVISAPMAALIPTGANSPVRVGANVQAANLVNQVRPVYPPLAKMARVQGTVKFEALIGKDGHIENLSVVSGPPLLIVAAMEAAQQWEYKPTLLNGQPVSVLTMIDINFTLSQ